MTDNGRKKVSIVFAFFALILSLIALSCCIVAICIMVGAIKAETLVACIFLDVMVIMCLLDLFIIDHYLIPISKAKDKSKELDEENKT